MIRHLFVTLFSLFCMVGAAIASDVVALGETPVAEFTLPDGSVVKNAFVWRRSSEGLMIVHDDGQYFLNFMLLPDEWKAAYLGESAVEPEPSDEGAELYEVDDPYTLMPILETIPELTEIGRTFVLRKDADENSLKHALALSVLQSLLSGKADDAKRLILLVEEMEIDIESVERDALFVECATCEATGRVEKECPVCNGTGKCPKCAGKGERDSSFGRGSVHCTSCRGKGDCLECAGVGSESTVCRVCHGRGKLLEKRYCEIQRARYVQIVNSSANPDITVSIMESDRDRTLRSLKMLPELERGAAAYFASDRYNGAMDTNILVACTLYSLLTKDLESAERFHATIKVHYGENSVLEINKYLKTCTQCEGEGVIERDCGTCGGSGECKRCGGDGQRDTGFRDKTAPCTTCSESGKCPSCKGVGTSTVRCSACEGTGRQFEKERTQVKLQLLVAALNQFYLEHQ